MKPFDSHTVIDTVPLLQMKINLSYIQTVSIRCWQFSD